MKIQSLTISLILGALSATSLVCAQAPIISSFNHDGVLTCTNMIPGTIASLELAPSPSGPWATDESGLAAVIVDYSGSIQITVPMFRVRKSMFYRVRGTSIPDGFAYIPAGAFSMGDNLDGEADASVHTVNLSAYFIAKRLVTKAEWDAVREWGLSNGYIIPSSGQGKAPNHAVQSVGWYDVVTWCDAKSEMEGLTRCYRDFKLGGAVDWTASGYRLPTEAEWEKSARGGLIGKRFPWGDTISHSNANYFALPYWYTSGYPPQPSGYSYDLSTVSHWHPAYRDPVGGTPYTSPVGSFAPNAYGLFDMAGNVTQWCWDFYYPDYTWSTGTNPRGGPNYNGKKVTRGGGWGADSYAQRCAYRGSAAPENIGYNDLGFRLVRSNF